MIGDLDVVMAKLNELDKKLALLEQTQENQGKKLDKISGGFSTALWITLGTLITSVTTWFIGGGFAK